MNKEQQAKIDAQLAKGNRNPDAYRPQIVEDSDAPVLSESWLLEEDSHVVTLEVYLISSKTLRLVKHQTGVIRGLTWLQLSAIQEAVDAYPIDPRLLDPDYEPTKAERVELQKRYNIRRRATVAQAIVDPKTEQQVFSYNGEGGRIPIEARSEALVVRLYEAYEVVNVPGKQVQFLNRFPDVGRDDGETAGTEASSDG